MHQDLGLPVASLGRGVDVRGHRDAGQGGESAPLACDGGGGAVVGGDGGDGGEGGGDAVVGAGSQASLLHHPCSHPYFLPGGGHTPHGDGEIHGHAVLTTFSATLSNIHTNV